MFKSCSNRRWSRRVAVAPHIEMLGNRSRVHQPKMLALVCLVSLALSCYPYCVRRFIFWRSDPLSAAASTGANHTFIPKSVCAGFPRASRFG